MSTAIPYESVDFMNEEEKKVLENEEKEKQEQTTKNLFST